MTTTDPRLPGQGGKPDVWTPTSPARSWDELLATAHGGVAALDKADRLVFVNDRFLSAIVPPADLVGLLLQDVLPALASDDPRQLRQQLADGQSIEFEQQFSSPDGDLHWFRITVVPSAELDGGLRAVVFAKAATDISKKFAQIRDATVSLAQVEHEWQRRLCRDVHDGPIQLLAALMLRLGMSDASEAKSLQHLVSEAAKSLRNVIEQFSPQLDRASGSLLERSIAPLIAGTGMNVSVDDQRADVSGLAEEHAAFVLLYQAVRAVRDSSVPRPIKVALADEQGGQRMLLAIPSGMPEVLSGNRAARFRTVAHHALSLGGTLTQSLDADNTRIFSMWIPRLTLPQAPTASTIPLRRTGTNVRP